MRWALHLDIQKALGVVRSHYEINFEAVAEGYIVPEGVEDEVAMEHVDALAADAAEALAEAFEEFLFPVLTPKFGKESDLWVRFDKESVWWKEGSFQRYSAKRSAVGYLLQFGKETVELILRDWMVTRLNQGERMDG
jgi:hypothetical protein